MTIDTPIIQWHGCYDDSWKGLITDESFAHPAKFAAGLIRRILAHGQERGWWKRGDLIGDPFGGIAGGGIMAGHAGLNWFGVELEPRFVAMGDANILLHRRYWLSPGCAIKTSVSVRLVQGDSRNFASIVREVAGTVTSPPYAETLNHGGGPDTKHDLLQGGKSLLGLKTGYGETDGQIGGLRAGDVAAVISSPPFEEQQSGGGIAKASGKNGNVRTGQNCGYQNQAATEGNIAGLPVAPLESVITSPPYAQQVHGGNSIDASKLTGNKAGKNSQAFAGGYGATSGNIGNLKEGKIDGVATSPPWGAGADGGLSAAKFKDPEKFAAAMAEKDGTGGRHATSPRARLNQMSRDVSKVYGEAQGQIGAASPETYWQAMHTVYGQCLLALRPGGVMAVVVKDYVKGGQRVPLCDQTLLLLTSLGFEPVERIHAMLVKETTRQGLFGAETKRTERKSFFRRLAEKKGSPRIDYEEVIVVKKPKEPTC